MNEFTIAVLISCVVFLYVLMRPHVSFAYSEGWLFNPSLNKLVSVNNKDTYKTERGAQQEVTDSRVSFNNTSQAYDKVSILGLPGAGKTVYFCACMDLLQRKFNDLGREYSVVYKKPMTSRIVRDTLSRLKHSEWPSNTQDNFIEHTVLVMHNSNRFTLSFKDYSGEYYGNFYGNDDFLDTFDVSQDSPCSDVVKGGGILLLIDSTILTEEANDELSTCLFNMLQELEMRNFQGKLAIVATKADLIQHVNDWEAEEHFKEQQPNSYACLKTLGCEYKFFIATAVQCSNEDVNDEGIYVPPMNYSPLKHSKNVCEPLYWLMDIKVTC